MGHHKAATVDEGLMYIYIHPCRLYMYMQFPYTSCTCMLNFYTVHCTSFDSLKLTSREWGDGMNTSNMCTRNMFTHTHIHVYKCTNVHEHTLHMYTNTDRQTNRHTPDKSDTTSIWGWVWDDYRKKIAFKMRFLH